MFFLSYFSCLDARETCVSTTFVTRHLASCKLCHVDPESIPYLGYLPHDIQGKSVLDFYHPEDLPLLKEVYQIGKSDKCSIVFLCDCLKILLLFLLKHDTNKKNGRIG
jgi:hypothetical protein